MYLFWFFHYILLFYPHALFLIIYCKCNIIIPGLSNSNARQCQIDTLVNARIVTSVRSVEFYATISLLRAARGSFLAR